jgi:hypothetical protein
MWHRSAMTLRLPLLALAASLLLPAEANAQPSQDQSIRNFLQEQFRADRADYPETRYASAWADLNGDGRPEALVYVMSAGYCGTGGCSLYVYTNAGRSWRRVARMTVSNPPIRLLSTRSRGWRDLGIRVQGGGIGPAYEARLSFNGRTYPLNPSVPPARPLRGNVAGRVLIPDSDRGRPLF